MTELELYKFTIEEGIELQWEEDKLICFIPYFLINDFHKLIKNSLRNEGIGAILKDDCIAFDLCEVCEYYDIEPENILKKNE